MLVQYTPALLRRFWSKVDTSGECWTWKAATTADGYGSFGTGDGRTMLTHRFSYQIHYGPIPNGLKACHRCDNPPCVRPDHLFLGTDADNTADRVAKGRGCLGEHQRSAKLTAVQVVSIRERYAAGAISQAALAAEYQVSAFTVSCIVRRKKWKHV